jgi:hypothetical protein
MNIEKCENCDTPLTAVELAAKNEDGSDAWCCEDCFYTEDEYSDHGKYYILLKFVKKLSEMPGSDCKECHCIACQAKKTLKKIGGK